MNKFHVGELMDDYLKPLATSLHVILGIKHSVNRACRDSVLAKI